MSQLVCMQSDLICRAGDGARLLDVIIVENNEGRGSPAGVRAWPQTIYWMCNLAL